MTKSMEIPTSSPDSSVSTVLGATLTLSSNSNPVTPLSTSWINAHISTHVPLEYHLWSSPPLPQLSPSKTPNSSASFHFDGFDDEFDEIKEKYLSDAAVSTPSRQLSPFSATADNSFKSPSVLGAEIKGRENCSNAVANESLIMNDYKKLVGDWDYFVIRLRVGIKGRSFDKSLMCLRLGSSNVWYFLMHQVFEIVFPDRARSSVRLRMEFLKIHDMKVADYHLVHKLKEKGCTKLHTGTLKLVRYIDLMRLIISMRRSSRFQTGGSQKSKDAIEQHKRLVDRIVRGLECEEKLYNKKFIGRLISDPGFINKILSRSNCPRGEQRQEVLANSNLQYSEI